MTERDDDARVSQRYRELPAEEPPRALDEAILAAARREVRAHPAPPPLGPWAPAGRRRWYVPVAAAALIVLAVAVTLRVQLEQPDLEAPDARAPPPATLSEPRPAPEAAKPLAKEAEKRAEPQREARKTAPERQAAARAEQAKPAEAPKTFVPDPAPPAAAPPAAAMRSAPMQRGDEAARDRAAERQAIGAMSAKRMQEPAPTPERELERIAELRKAGRHDEADKALAEFRKRYPDYKIPEKTLERVERR